LLLAWQFAQVLQWMALAGACCMLAMTSCLPLLRLPACRSPPPAGVAGDLAGDAGGMGVHGEQCAGPAIPRPVLFFPLMIWAAFRGRLLGACLSGSLLCLLLSLPGFFPVCTCMPAAPS
jgi:hypothetical protein